MGIHFQEVRFSYMQSSRKKRNLLYVVEGANINIKANDEFIAILGHTGSGKSTLVQLMNALLIPIEGKVTVCGSEITPKKQPKLKPIRKKVGLVFQFPEYQLFEESVLKDIAFGPKNFGKTLEEANEDALYSAKLVKIDPSILNKSPFALSGGQMRKVAIAGILASNPDILIFDEPTVGLDPLAKKELLSLLKDLNEQHKSIIIITHDMDVVSAVAKRVIVMDSGNIVYDGSKEELFSNKEFIKEHSLDTPTIIKIMEYLKQKTGLEINTTQFSIDEAYQELLRVINNER